MATPSGAPPAQTPTATTTSTSSDKKKLFIAMGVAGIAALGIGGFFVMQSLKGDATEVANSAVAPLADASGAGQTGGAPNQGGRPASTLPNGGIPPANAIPVSAVSNPSTLLPLSPYRPDPFQPFVVLPVAPTPMPPPPPIPAPPRPTPIPEPVIIPQPDSVNIPLPGGGDSGGSVFGGGMGSDSGAAFAVPGLGSSPALEGPLILPGVVIPSLNARRIIPTNAFPPPRSSSGAGSGVTSPSFDKRLSGVIIGNGVRAVLEINSGATPKSYVVQPGDVVEGITILNIQRLTEGGKQVTRMLIRDNGGERSVELKPGPPRTNMTGGGGFGGPPGFGRGGGGGGFGRP